MVDGQIRTFDVTDQNVIEAFAQLPRERFLPPDLRILAYSDRTLAVRGSAPDAPERVMLAPMHLARMMQSADVRPTDRVLVVAGETGYAACLLAQFAASVISLESDPALTAAAAANARELGFANVNAVTGPLPEGVPDGAPYDVVLVQGAVETGLDRLLQQLAPDGRLIAIETKLGGASRRAGKVMRFERASRDVSERAVFDATAPVIAEFRDTPGFVF
jgi:protein-L-isoaspartate(D-aspartate) O-methyltransferase